MLSRNSWRSPVYWVFRLSAVLVIGPAVLHGIAWATTRQHLHRTATCMGLTGVGIGLLPLVAALGLDAYTRLRRGPTKE